MRTMATVMADMLTEDMAGGIRLSSRLVDC